MQCPKCRKRNREDARQCRHCGRGLEIGLLQVVQGQLPEPAYVLKPRTYHLGRSEDNDVVLPDASVSRVHARLSWEGGVFVIEDLKSRHGLLVDSAKVRKAVLSSGRLLQLGSVVLRLVLVDPEASTAEGLQIPKDRLSPVGPAGPGREAAVEALDRLHLGVLLVAADGSPLLVNRSAQAILDEQDGLSVGPGGLRARDTSATKELRRLLSDASDTKRGGAVAVPRASRRPLTVLVTPLGAESGRLEKPGAVKAVFLSDPERGIETGEQILERLYGLTPAEARLAGELLQGKTLDEASDGLAITTHTARSHLKSIFAKTDTRRQSELVRLLLSGPAQLRAD